MKAQSLKRLLSGLLAALMLCTLLPTPAWAATTVASGSCGENLTWTLDSAGKLTISGTGEMEDYTYSDKAPWEDYADSIQTVVIQQGVTSIGDYAFYRYDSLASVTIANSVTSIGFESFYYCTSLNNIHIGSGVTEIGAEAFIQSAYYRDANNWENGILYLGEYLLGADQDITTASIRQGTRLIADMAFGSCYSLNSINIPSTVVFIGNRVFCECRSLNSINIPDSVTNIGISVFGRCTSLEKIYVHAKNPNYSSDSYGILFNKAKTELVCCPAGFTDSCYTIPDSVTSIEQNAFYICTNLSSIISSGNITRIGGEAFKYTAYYYDENNWEDGLLYWDTYLIDAKRGVETASIRSDTSLIADGTFFWGSITTVSIPESVIAIGDSAFRYSAIMDVYYAGSPSQWEKITIGIYNERLLNASIHYARLDAPKISSSIVSSSGAIKLSWNSVSGASKYYLYRCTDGTSYKYYDSTTKTSYTNLSVTPGKTYYYKVKSVAADGTMSGYSNVTYRTADCAAPKISSSIITSTGRIKLTWSAIDGASKYYIYRSTDGGKTYKRYDTTTKTSYTNQSVTPGKTYYYKVKAVCDRSEYGNSAYSNVANRTADCAKPVVTIQLSGGKPQLKWSAVEGAKEYVIYRSGYRDGTYTKMYTTTKLSYTNTGAKAGYTYYYKVVAVCKLSSYGNSAYSNVVSIKCK